jgi:SHS2 domain-containing protein
MTASRDITEPTHRFVEHGGEVEVELGAASEAGIFAAALDAFAELVVSDGAGPTSHRRIELAGRDRCLLLVDWLNELLFLGEVEQFVRRTSSRSSSETSVSARRSPATAVCRARS